MELKLKSLTGSLAPEVLKLRHLVGTLKDNQKKLEEGKTPQERADAAFQRRLTLAWIQAKYGQDTAGRILRSL